MESLTIENHQQLSIWINKANYKEFNANIHTMLMWNATYPISFIIKEHFALACFTYNNAKHWFAPFCEEHYLVEATQYLLEYSHSNHIALGVHSITQTYKDFLETNYTNKVYFENHISSQDYIYDRTQQETLIGKKMQKRRNHYNSFIKEYGDRFSYFPLSKEHFQAIYELLNSWQLSKGDSETIREEDEGIHYLLDHFQELSIFGGCLYIDGVLQAFSIASYISEDMVQIHVEKANREIRGLYVAILKHFLATLPEEVTLVNREDDMGLDSLRKAKHDMRPLYQIKKYAAYFGEVTIQHPSDQDLHQMKDLWHTSFTEENEATTQFFFEEIMQKERAYVMKNREGIMAMAFLNKWEMILDGKKQTVYFLEGVAVEEDYQRCGVMKKLIRAIQNEYSGQSIALQAYDWDLYRSFGFHETHFIQRGIIDQTYYQQPVGTLKRCDDPTILNDLYESFIEGKDGYRIRDLAYYTDFYIPYQIACANTIELYIDQETKGYVCYHEEEQELMIEEIIYYNQKTLDHMLASLVLKGKPISLSIDVHAKVEGTMRQEIILMMNRSYHNELAYLNENI